MRFTGNGNKNSGISTAIYYPRSSVLNRQCCELSIKQFSTTVPNLEEVERQAIATAIRQNDGNLTATAEQLGISRQTLYNKIKRFKL